MENVLINKEENGDLSVKIADFGLATFLPSNPFEMLDFACGTPVYIAPEVLNYEGYREKVDIFSVGSIMFNLSTRMSLFGGPTPEYILELNKQCDLS